MGLNQYYEAARLGDSVKGAARACALVLAVHVNVKGLTWPSQGTIAREAAVTRATAFKAIRLLESLGVISYVYSRRVAKRKSGQALARAANQMVDVYRWHGRIRPPSNLSPCEKSAHYKAAGRSEATTAATGTTVLTASGSADGPPIPNF